MMIRLKKALRRFRRDEKGVTLVEYGIAITLAVAVGTAALSALSTAIENEMTEATECIDGTNTACP